MSGRSNGSLDHGHKFNAPRLRRGHDGRGWSFAEHDRSGWRSPLLAPNGHDV